MGRRVVDGRVPTLKPWARAAALAALLLALPSGAAAQGGLAGGVRYLAGYTHESPEVLGSAHDLWTGVTPQLSYLYVEPRWLLRATYAFTAAVHTRNAAEIANRITLVSSYELSRRTTLLLAADGNQTSLSTYLVQRPVIDNSVVLLPGSNSRLLMTTASQGLAHEASPRVTLGQTLDASYVMSLDPAVDIANFFANAVLSADHAWKRDSAGIDLRAGYASVRTAPLPEQKFVTLTPAPHWRHDWTPELSSSLSGGASLVTSPTSETRSIITPYVRAAVLYSVEASSLELSYTGGTVASVLTGQLLRTHLVTVRGTAPLSERHRVMLSGSVGYLNGSTIDLRENPVPSTDVDAILGDIDVSWLATDWMQLFARGVFSAQDNGVLAEPSVREAVILGLQLSTQAPDGVNIPVRFPQRVDRGDAPARPR